MSDTLRNVQDLAVGGDVMVSHHGYNELAEDGISARDAVTGIARAQVVEDYPDYHRGPCVLVLQWDRDDKPIHVLWGIPRSQERPAVLITAYRPDPTQWTADFRRRVQ